MKIVNRENIDKTRVEMDGAERAWRQLPISAGDGSPNVSVRVFTLEPEGHTPFHTHPFEHVNYIISGQGVLVTGTGEEHPVRSGDFALVLPDEKHQYRNTSADSDFVFICAVPGAYE